jgi:hypothetical protein
MLVAARGFILIRDGVLRSECPLGWLLCQAPEHVEGNEQERLGTLGFATHKLALAKPPSMSRGALSYGPPWAHYLGGYQDRLLGGPLGLPGLCRTVPNGVRRKDYGGEVLR